MTTMLSNEEKVNIINQHIKNLEFALYNTTLDLLEANAVSTGEKVVEDINKRQIDISTKIAALEAERSSLTE
jgi:hypothetical protein